MPFQKTVNLYNPLAVAGDFASTNPRATYDASEGALVAGLLGVTVGKFAWVDGATNSIVSNSATSNEQPSGFVHRDQQGLITVYLGEASMLIPEGFPVTLHVSGDFWAKLTGSTAVTPGTALYVNFATGDIQAGSAPTGAAATGAIGSTFTATATGTSLAVTAVTGLISIGDTIAGTGVPTGTTIVAQVSGTTGGAGTYTTSAVTTAAAATVTSFGNVLNVTAVSSGTLNVGDAISGTGVPANTTIASQVSGATGGVGVYTISSPATAYAASTAITVVAGVALTKWTAKNFAAVGELVKISTY
jgi:hypothetical protein